MRSIAVLAAALLLLGDAVNAAAPSARTPSLLFASRGEAAKLILQARKGSIPAFRETGEFPDVLPGSPHESAIIAAARFGFVEPHPVTRELRPFAAVTRAELLAMLGRAYGLPAFPHGYADVPPTAWYAPYAGIAERYRLFPVSAQRPEELRPDDPVRRLELGLALRIFLNVWERQSASSLLRQSQEQSAYRLALYQRISTQTGELSVVHLPRPAFPAPAAPAPPRSPEPTIEEKQAAMLAFINEARRRAGGPGLRRNASLEASAREYAGRMAREGFFSHVSPERQTLDGRIDVGSIRREGRGEPDCLCIEKAVFAENLARNAEDAAEAFDAWMRSGSHRSAILNPAYTDAGIGVRGDVWVAHFGGIRRSE